MIMFNDKYGLTQAVLEGRKTMTRRIIRDKVREDADAYVQRNATKDWDKKRTQDEAVEYIIRHASYKVGEVVAVAQRYKDVLEERGCCGTVSPLVAKAGYMNKMFVRADLMPHQIRITNVRIERLQDISDEDCLLEGIAKHNALPDALGMDRYKFISFCYDATQDRNRKKWWFKTPRAAFAALIDKISCKGTWQSNPWVYVYSFELVK